MISRELFCEVMGINNGDIPKDTDISLFTEVKGDGIDCPGINIYELAHKCRKWAFKNDYEIISRIRKPDIYRGSERLDYGYMVYLQGDLIDYSWWIDTEPEAIFEACEWILNNKENHND